MALELDKGIALKETNDLFQGIKEDLNKVSSIENMIEGMDLSNLDNKNFNSFDELEIITEKYNKEELMINRAKWVLIIFESLTAYVAISTLMHLFGIPENLIWIKQIIAIVVGIISSYLLINAGISAIKNDSKNTGVFIAILLIFLIPLMNLGIILFSGTEINFKEIYIISSIISFIGGLTIITWSKAIYNNNNGGISVSIYKNLTFRKKLISSSRKKYSNIFNKINKSGQIILQSEEINTYFSLKEFLNEKTDFDNWSFNYIKKTKERMKEQNIFNNK